MRTNLTVAELISPQLRDSPTPDSDFAEFPGVTHSAPPHRAQYELASAPVACATPITPPFPGSKLGHLPSFDTACAVSAGFAGDGTGRHRNDVGCPSASAWSPRPWSAPCFTAFVILTTLASKFSSRDSAYAVGARTYEVKPNRQPLRSFSERAAALGHRGVRVRRLGIRRLRRHGAATPRRPEPSAEPNARWW